MKREISFGKFAIGSNRRINEVTIEIELREDRELSICGKVWNMKHTDCIMCGQCLDELYSYLKFNPLFMEIYWLWRKYHLNYVNAGTIEQERCLNMYRKRGDSYPEDCETLKQHGLYEIEGYKYGHAWLHRELPSYVKDRVIRIIRDYRPEYKTIL